jgi:hypothetical protein
MKVKKTSDYLTEVRTKGKANHKQKYLLISDIHYDSTCCRRDLLKKHLDKALQEDRKIIINGDWFDVMGGYKDPRSKPQDIRPEYYSTRSYLDLVLEDSYNFLKPYANNILLIAYGNHETAIVKHRDTDILERLHGLLCQINTDIVLGGYDGWIKFMFEHEAGGLIKSSLMHYHHGSGGNAMRSKGILRNQIDGFIYPDADIIIRGHDHMKSHDPSNVRIRVDNVGKQFSKAQHVIRTGSYKDGSLKRFGWEVEKAFLPTKMGGWFMDLKYASDGIKIKVFEAD